METSPHAPSGAPLTGVRVLDLTRLLPGPMATLHLADLGADVIKIEDTGAGDYAGPAVRALVNRNKRGIRLDLKNPAGVADQMGGLTTLPIGDLLGGTMTAVMGLLAALRASGALA